MIDDDGPPGPYSRDESVAHRLDRNYAELLQELRVGQTGVQILFAFLLAIAFQQRFDRLSDGQRWLYLATLAAAAVAAVLLIAPVSMHRIVFRQRRKQELVVWTSRLALAGLGCLMLAMTGAVALVADVVAGAVVAVAMAVPLGLLCLALWYVVPLRRVRVDPPER